MNSASPFVSLLFITILAALVPPLVGRIRPIRLPIVVGEIIAGILIGKSGLNLVEPTRTLDFLSQFGFVFLMFLSGLEVSFADLLAPASADKARPRWQRPLPLAGAFFGLTLLLATGVGFSLSMAGLIENPILMGLILSTTSLGIVLPVLKERNLLPTSYGQFVLVAALIGDFATLLLLSVTIALIRQGPGLELLLFGVLFLAFLGLARLGRWAGRIPGLTSLISEFSHATAQLDVRGAFALMIIWVVLAEALGVEVILGAFLAGALISVSRPRPDTTLRDKLDVIGFGFFIPLFFIMVGANFDLAALTESPRALLLVPVLVVAAYAVKLLPALLFRTRLPWRQTWAAGTLLASRLSLIIAASAIALQLQLIRPSVNAAIILVAVVTCTISPILFGRILGVEPQTVRKGVVILGADQLSRLVGARLQSQGEPLTFITADLPGSTQLRNAGFAVVEGDPGNPQVLAEAGAATARALLAIGGPAEELLAACRVAKTKFNIPAIAARAEDRAQALALEALQIPAIQAVTATALALEGAIRFPGAFQVLTEPTRGVDLLDTPLTNRALAGQPLRRIRLPGNALVLGIRRHGEIIIPHGDTVLQAEDILMLVGDPHALAAAAGVIGTTGGAPQASRPGMTGEQANHDRNHAY